MTDPIVDEVRQAREAHAAKFNFDLDAIFQDIKKQEASEGQLFVDLTIPDRSAMSPVIQLPGIAVPPVTSHP